MRVKQPPLRQPISLTRLVKIEMICPQIIPNSHVKRYPVDAPLHNPMARHLHCHQIAPRIRHRTQQTLQLQRPRRRIDRTLLIPRIPMRNRPQNAHFQPHHARHRLDQIRRRRLPIRPRHRHDLHLTRRIAPKTARQLAKMLVHIGQPQNGQTSPRAKFRIANNRSRTRRTRLRTQPRRNFSPQWRRPLPQHKNVAHRQLSRVIAQLATRRARLSKNWRRNDLLYTFKNPHILHLLI